MRGHVFPRDTWEWSAVIKRGDGLKLCSLEVDLNAQELLFCPLHVAEMVH